MRKVKGDIPHDLAVDLGKRDVGLYEGFEISTFRELVEKTAQLSYANKDHLSVSYTHLTLPTIYSV